MPIEVTTVPPNFEMLINPKTPRIMAACVTELAAVPAWGTYELRQLVVAMGPAVTDEVFVAFGMGKLMALFMVARLGAWEPLAAELRAKLQGRQARDAEGKPDSA